MKNYLHHLQQLLKHKIYVLIAGTKLGCSFRRLLVLHDLSEIFYYESSDFRDSRKKCDWRYWVHIPNGIDKSYKIIEIPEKYVYEMIANWMASVKEELGQFKYIVDWYENNHECMLIHPATDRLIRTILEYNGYFVTRKRPDNNDKLNDLLRQATHVSGYNKSTSTVEDIIRNGAKMTGFTDKQVTSLTSNLDKSEGYCWTCRAYHPKEQPCLSKRNNW